MSGVLARFEIKDWADVYGTATKVVDLTLLDHGDGAPAGPAYTAYAAGPDGGGVDLYGQRWTPAGAARLVKKGQIIADTRAELQQRSDELRALRGVPGKVFMTMDDGTSRWTNARCELVDIPRNAENTLFVDVTLQWSQLDPYWRGAHYGGIDGGAWLWNDKRRWGGGTRWGDVGLDTLALVSGAPGSTTMALGNDGNAPIYWVKFTLHAGSVAITKVEIEQSILGIFLRYIPTAGTIGAGGTLIIDTRTRQVYNAGTGDYAGLARVAPDHFLPSWFMVPPGGNSTYTVRIWGGGTGSWILPEYDGAWG